MQSLNYTLEQRCLRKFQHEKVIGQDFKTFIKNSMTRLAEMKPSNVVGQYATFKSVDDIPSILDDPESQAKEKGAYVSEGPLVYQKNEKFEELMFHLERIRQYGDEESYQAFLSQYKAELQEEMLASSIPVVVVAEQNGSDIERGEVREDVKLLETEEDKGWCQKGCGIM